jgi:hypothetical protein
MMGRNTMATAGAILAFVSVGLATVFSMMIVREVSKRGVKINFVLLRMYIIKYIDQYKKMTLKETGKVGPLYYPCVGSYVMALVFAIVYLIAR